MATDPGISAGKDAVRPKLAIIALAVGLLAPFASVIVATPAAWALNCDINSDHHTFGSFFWTRTGNDVYGVRAPIQKRVDGEICSDSTADPAINWSSIWISIFQSTPGHNGINQAGMMHVVKNGNHTWCRAYAGGTGQWTAYDCGSDNNDQFVWFQIRTTTDGLHYHIEDCGTSGGYGSCTLDFGADSPYPDPEGGTFIETYFGCEISITGSQADQQNVGNSTYHLQGEANNGTGGTEWAARNWGNQGVYWYGIDGTKHTSTCGTTDYQMTEVNMGEQLKFYDARNNT